MATREEVLDLKSSRKGHKGLVTRANRATMDAIESFIEGNDPFYLEAKLNTWEKRLDSYRDAEAAVVCHSLADEHDFDKDLELYEDFFYKAQVKIRGYRQDFDRMSNALDSDDSSDAPNSSHNSGLPRLNIKRPPILEEDTNLRSFIQWVPLWNNYTTLIAFSKRDRITQVSLFWECCSPGFLQIVHHSLGIKPDTGREVDEILAIIKDYLRSLRSVHLDMRELLQVTQREGQDYTSLCNNIRELAEFADVGQITEDKLLIALLLQAMTLESDRAKVMELNPKTFDEARHHILELETSRRGAKGMASSIQINAARSKSRYRSQKDAQSQKLTPKPSGVCGYCGLRAHPKDSCPARKSICRSCKQTGHWDKACRSKPASPGSRISSLKLRASSSNSSGPISNLVDIAVTPSNFSGEPKTITFCADTGADISVMSHVIFLKSGLDQIVTLSKDFSDQITGIDGKPVHQLGMFHATLQVDDAVAHDIPIVVCHGLNDAFLSLDACRILTIIGDNFPFPGAVVASVLLTDQKTISSSQPDFWTDRDLWISKLPNLPLPDLFKLIDGKLKDIYCEVFDDKTLRPMVGPVVGEPMVIHLKENAKPFAIYVARNVPYSQMAKLEKILTDLTQQDIICPVGDEVTEWCHPIVLVVKSNGDLRFCVDLTRLNTEVKRSIHPIKTPVQAIAGFKPDQKFFAKIDLVKGYWQMPLAEESQHLTTFLTSFGKFKFLRSPMGFVSTGDSFSYRGDVAMAGLDIQKVVDDMACGASSLPELIRRVSDILERCHKFGLTVNLSKSVLAAESIDFVGFRISPGKIEADPSKVNAIQDFAIPNLASLTSPFRGLLKTKNNFLWLAEHTIVFEEIKQALLSPLVLEMYDPNLECVLLTDASRRGLGFALIQSKDGVPKLIQCGSRYLYLAGVNFRVVTDHKPLIPIFNRQSLPEIENPRVLNYRTRLMAYNFVVEWKKGVDHAIPGAFSRAPVSNSNVESDELDDPTDYVLASLKLEHPDMMLEEISQIAKADESYSELRSAILSDSVKSTKSGYVAQFKKIASELSVEEDLILRGKRIVIPPSAVKSILQKLHSSHQGVEKTKRRARQIVYWPSYSSDIANTVAACPHCLYFRPSHAQEPLLQDTLPSRPFQVVTADLFTYEKCEYLVYSDRLSNYPLVAKYTVSPGASSLIKDFSRFFALFGVPNVLRTDNGPQFASSLFGQFLAKWGVSWKSSSPYYPQSNGHAEVMVKSIKYLLAKTGGDINSETFTEGILEFRNTPMSDGFSPAQRVFGRPLRSRIPVHEDIFLPISSEVSDSAKIKRKKIDDSRKYYYDATSKPLGPLPIGCSVLVQNPRTSRWDQSATVIKTYHRRYLLKFDNGNKSWRNRRFLRDSHDVGRDNSADVPGNSDMKNVAPRRSLRKTKKPQRLKYD